MALTREIGDIAYKAKRRLARRKVLRRLKDQQGGLTKHSYQVGVYFGDPLMNFYQLRQWVGPLRELAASVGVVCIFRSAETALAALDDPTFTLPVAYAGAHRDLDPIIASQDLKVVLYVNHHQRNFAMLWQPSVLHVYIGHGESDKVAISASNQLKAYDFTLVAGQAAIDRINRRLINYDTDDRAIAVGRPQVDQPIVDRAPTTDKPLTVLYAPSWEGDRSFNHYGTLESHGERFVEALLADGRYRVIFRPHPLTGKLSRSYAKAGERIAARLAAANQARPQSAHLVDRGPDFGWQLAAADCCIADISAVAFDWLASGKPLVIAEPSGQTSLVDPQSAIARLPMVSAQQAADVPRILDEVATGSVAAELESIREYCFGDATPGSATSRFVGAITDLMALRDRQISSL